MMEIPEAAVTARQLNKTVRGRKIISAEAAHSPHKFTWYQGDPKDYPGLLKDKMFEEAYPLNGTLEMRIGDVFLALSEGANLTYHPAQSKMPQKH